jgi:hypothetical protein
LTWFSFSSIPARSKLLEGASMSASLNRRRHDRFPPVEINAGWFLMFLPGQSRCSRYAVARITLATLSMISPI